jgi:16S rRNA C967 or C1407 C5-methylase (RsmB/RsmF family)/NOL1/NOP2/fmu family ribosome biogenesis protein
MKMSELKPDFIARILYQFGDEGAALIKSLDEIPQTSVRFNTRKPLRSHLETTEVVPWCANAYFLSQRPLFTMDPLFHAGCYYPQESSSMFLEFALNQILQNARDITCLDFCAAPGGKSLILSDFIGENGRLVANEVNRNRNAILREVIAKWGCENTIVTSASARAFGELQGYFDCVLVDAPCSGEGMFRKDQGARDEWSLDAVKHCAASQKEILSELQKSVANEGYLIYSTCTFSVEENQQSCSAIAASLEFEPVKLDVSQFPEILVIEGDGFYGYQFLPNRVRGEGFFLAVFRRSTPITRAFPKRNKSVFVYPSKLEHTLLSKQLIWNYSIVKDINGYCWLSRFGVDELNLLAGLLYVNTPGIEIGHFVREELIPAHAISMTDLIGGSESLDVELSQAISYLRGETIQLISMKGWAIITYKGINLGWVKCMGARSNNYYPKECRIRMKNPDL